MTDFNVTLLCVRHGSNERDSSYSTERSRPVMLIPFALLRVNSAKHLAADRDRPFASLRVTRCDCSNGQKLFFKLNLALTNTSRYVVDAQEADKSAVGAI